MLLGRPACCDASNCDDVLHHSLFQLTNIIVALFLYVKIATDSCVAVHKVALVMNMMCPTSLNIFVITIVTLERLSGLGNCWEAYRIGTFKFHACAYMCATRATFQFALRNLRYCRRHLEQMKAYATV